MHLPILITTEIKLLPILITKPIFVQYSSKLNGHYLGLVLKIARRDNVELERRTKINRGRKRQDHTSQTYHRLRLKLQLLGLQ